MHKAIPYINFSYLAFRRVIELLVIFLCAPIFIVIFLFAAVWITFDTPGTVLFSQLRPGQNGKLFKIYKFRSMYTSADSSYLTMKADARITRSGAFIRRYRIDELPQIFNILKGDMSFIGPRPVPVEFLAQYEREIDNYQMRHLIKPGITGLAQVRQGYTTTVAEERQKLRYDLLYIRSVSLKLDLSILFHSIFAIKE
ncbi:MAG: sugar transferase [Pedobacter sp.]|uniref:sugar transferase n=1 Tax=Pedobacter sp. TaxID=1411316 RepID=UPI003394F6C0